MGKTTSSGMATTNVHQVSLNGTSDGFIASFDDNGNRNWHTYYGGEAEDAISLLVQKENSLYLYGSTFSKTNIATEGSFQETIAADATDDDENYLNGFIANFSKTGERIWATYYGIAKSNPTSLLTGNTPLTGISANETGLYILGWDNGNPTQTNNTYFGTSGAFMETKPVNSMGWGMSLFLSKFSFDGDRLWSTYFSAYNNGNPAATFPNYKATGANSSRAITATVNGVYISGRTAGSNGVGTTGTFQPTKTGFRTFFVTQFSDTGERLWGSYLGNSATGAEYGDLNALSHDTSGNIYISGSTSLVADIATEDAYQVENNGYSDGYVAKIAPDGTDKMYATYYGGSQKETNGYTLPLGNGSGFYLIGTTESPDDIATEGAWQEELMEGGEETKNIFITKFVDENLSTPRLSKNKFVLYPNPNNGNFTIHSEKPLQNVTIQIFDMLGREILVQKTADLNTLNLSLNLPVGIYLLKLIAENNLIYTDKIIISK